MKRILLFLALIALTITIQAQNHRYLNITTFGILSGTSSDENQAPLSILSEHHYRFHKLFSAGLATGIEQLNENTMPLALNLKFYLPAGGSDFFFSAMGGYSVSLNKPEFEGIKKSLGGKLADMEAGVMIRANDCFSVVFALGYRYNVLNYKAEDWWIGSYKRRYTYNRFVVRLGISIN
jgi:hypothetical protein